jgi:5'-3' exonuclease
MNLDLHNKKFNPNFIFYLDFGPTLDINNKYGKLEYYFFNEQKLIKLLDDSEFKNNVNKDYLEKNNRYQKLLKFEYDSKIKKHIIAMKDMNLREKELYLIEKKLDKYYVLFNPNNRFFDTLNKKDYYKNNNVRIMVSEYLKGFKWLINYYFKRKNVDEFWYYPFHISPLLSDLVNYFNHSLLSFNFMDKKLNINPLQALLYIAPIKISKINEFLESVDVNNTEKKKIKNFIESNLDLFYNLDEIYYTVLKGDLKKGLFDCSTATFISKCNYLILEDVKPINRFKIIL